MNVLITGGAGFIGSHLCDRLIQRNYNITVIDNLILGRIDNIAHLLENDKFLFIKQDICHLNSLREVFRAGNFNCVYHLAANSDIQKGGEDSTVDYELTFKTTYNVLRSMHEFGVKKMFFASSSAIYGDSQEDLTEDFGPLLPVSNYGASKLASEAYISAFSSMYNIQAWIARFPNVVGERFTHGVIYDFINKIYKDNETLTVLGDGEQTKPFLYVKDLIEGILFICDNANERYNVFNLGSQSRTKVKTIARMVVDEMGFNSKIVYTGGKRGWAGDVPEFKYDLKKVHGLGWRAKYDSNESVRMTIKKVLGK